VILHYFHSPERLQLLKNEGRVLRHTTDCTAGEGPGSSDPKSHTLIHKQGEAE
jgi:hypothetical protein